MDRGKRGKTVTTSPLTKKSSTSSLKDALFVVADEFGCIVEVFDVVPPILLEAIPSPSD